MPNFTIVKGKYTTEEGEEKNVYYPRFCQHDVVSTADIARSISESTTFNAGEAMGVLMELKRVVQNYLAMGYSVELDGLFTLVPSVQYDPDCNKKNDFGAIQKRSKRRHSAEHPHELRTQDLHTYLSVRMNSDLEQIVDSKAMDFGYKQVGGPRRTREEEETDQQ